MKNILIVTGITVAALILVFAISAASQRLGSPREKIADSYRSQLDSTPPVCRVCDAPEEAVRVEGPIHRHGEGPSLIRNRNGDWVTAHCLNG